MGIHTTSLQSQTLILLTLYGVKWKLTLIVNKEELVFLVLGVALVSVSIERGFQTMNSLLDNLIFK